MWNDLLFRARALFRRKAVEGELDAELRFHLEQSVEKRIHAGMTREEALHATRLEFGGHEQVKEECREARGVNLMETSIQDARFGLRLLRKNPGFTAVAVATLALGIGANTAMFSALNTLLLRPLPVEKVERLVFVLSLREGFDPFGTSAIEYIAYREHGHSFASAGLAAPERSFNVLRHGQPERIQGAAILASYLTTLGVKPIIGRSFTPEEDRPGGPAVALVSYGLWRRSFGGDPNLVGSSLDLNGRSTTIVGILPPLFDLPDASQIWIPLQLNLEALPLSDRSAHAYEVVARLKPGATLQQADTEMKQALQELEQQYPQLWGGWGVKVISLRQQLIGDLTGRVQNVLFTLVAAVGFVLLICCTNVASLLLARGVAREREIALRRALGAGWGRVMRQLLTECLLLAALGGVVGLALAYSIVPLLSTLNPIDTVALAGVLRNIQIDARVLGFVAAVTLLTGAICALIPVVKAATSNDLLPLIKDGGHRGGVGGAGRRWLAALVVGEMAIAVPLLVGGGLTIQSFQRLQHIEVGFRPENLLAMHMELSPVKYREFSQRVNFVRQVVDRVKNLPGVVSVGTTTNMPLTLFISYDSVFAVEGHPPVNPSDVPITSHRLVSPEYLQTLGVTLVKGRLLDERDRADKLPVVVVTEELARQAWGAEDPLGKRIKRVREGTTFPWLTVVGVVKDIKEDRFNFRIARPAWYLPYEQYENAQPLDLLVRAAGDPVSLTASISDAVHAVDPDQAVSDVTTMKTFLAGVVVTERFSAVLMGALAGVGLILAVIGLYGVMAYSVSRQTGEMGLRVALGARPGDILRMVVGRGARLTVAGLLLGLLGAWPLTRFLSGALYDVNPNDPLTFVVVSVVLAGVALGACYFPARRATKVDPVVALRYE